MKRFYSLLITLCMIFSIIAAPIPSFAEQATNQTGASINPDHITLTWTDDPMTTQTITWRTDASINQGIVRYAKEADKANFPDKALTQAAKMEIFDTGLGDVHMFSATLKDLEPGTNYIYQVGDGTNWSEVKSFTTETQGTNKFKFLIFGDSQSGNVGNPDYTPWETTLHNAYNANTDAKFFINVGDLVEQGQNYTHWNNWFKAADGIIDKIPAMPVQGNHETYNPSGPSSKPVYWMEQFKLPQNGPDRLKGQTYSFDYGNAHIVVLDSQEEEEKDVAGDILESQKAWLDNDLKNTDKEWKILLFHKTTYYNKATRTNEDIKAAFQPIIDKYHVDVVFNGHDHGIGRTYPINNDTFVDSPAKGTVYYVTGRSGNKTYSDLSKKIWDAFFYDPQDEPNYIVAEVDGSKLTLKAVKQDGTILDTYTIDKASGADSPKTVLPQKYVNTQVVLYGKELMNGTDNVVAQKVYDKFYIPTEIFIKAVGGTFSKDESKAYVTYNGKAVVLTVGSKVAKVNGGDIDIPDQIIKDENGNILISSDDINRLFGITYRYDSTFNMILFPCGIQDNSNPGGGNNPPLPGTGSSDKHVINLILDGLSSSLYNRLKQEGLNTPNIDELISNGTILDNVKTTIPSYGAAQASSITGASPEKNGMLYRYYNRQKGSVSNDSNDPFTTKSVNCETIFESIMKQNPDIRTLAIGMNVMGLSLEGRGISKTDANHKLIEYGLGDSLVKFDTVSQDVINAVYGYPENMPNYILAYSNDIKMSYWGGGATDTAKVDEKLRSILTSIDSKIGDIKKALIDKGIYNDTDIVINSLSSIYPSTSKINGSAMASDITKNTGVKTEFSAADVASDTKAVIVKTYIMKYGQLSFTNNATQDDKDKVLAYLKDKSNKWGQLLKDVVTPDKYGASSAYADYILIPVDNYTFSQAGTGCFRTDTLDDMNQFFVVSGNNIKKGAKIDSGSVLDIPSNISYMLGANPPKDNEGKRWDIYNTNNLLINIKIDGEKDQNGLYTGPANVTLSVYDTNNLQSLQYDIGGGYKDYLGPFTVDNDCTLKVKAIDKSGNITTQYRNLYFVKTAPAEVTINITNLQNKQIVKSDKITVEGNVDKKCDVKINGEAVTLNDDNTFSKEISLKDGLNTITIEAILNGMIFTKSIKVDYVNPNTDYVVYINWDGFAKYYYDLANQGGTTKTPVLNELIKNGVIFNNMYTGIPSITGAMQPSIVSGAWPKTTGNAYRYYNKKENKVIQFGRENNAETIAEAAVRQGLKTASIQQFTLLDKGTTIGDPNKPYIEPGGDYAKRFDTAIKLIKGEPVGEGAQNVELDEIPRFMALYMDDLDAIGHNMGDIEGVPVVPTEAGRLNAVLNRLQQMDAKLGEFIQALKDRGIYDNMTFVLTTDHGMAPYGQQGDSLDPYGYSKLPDLVNTLQGLGYKVEVLFGGDTPKPDTDIVLVTVGLQVQLSFTKDYTNNDIQKIINAVKDKEYLGKIMTKDEMDERGAIDGFADLLISPKTPYHFKANPPDQQVLYKAWGQHDSLDESAQHVFSIMWGKGVKKGYVDNEKRYVIDFARTMATSLGIDGPKDATGQILTEALENGGNLPSNANGDINNDGKISIGDLGILANYYGKKESDADWDVAKFADLNNDGQIGLEDLIILANKILRQ